MECSDFKKYEYQVAQGKRWCYDCKNFYKDHFCGYEACNCEIHGSLDCNQHERDPEKTAMICPDYQRAKRPLWFLEYVNLYDALRWSPKLVKNELENLKR